jgi:uncharacterized membrane protein
MKKILICLSIFFFILLPSSVFAQEDQSNLSTTTQYFDITLVREGQSAFNKAVTYTVYVTPKIDSSRTQITWDAPVSIDINPKHKEFIDMYRDQTYSFKASIKAKREGSYEISVNLIAWQHDTNYTNSVSDIITFNSNLLAVPVGPSYTYSLIAKYLLIALVIVFIVWALYIYGKKGLKSFKDWLTPPK